MALGTIGLHKLLLLASNEDVGVGSSSSSEEDVLSVWEADLTTLTSGQRVILGIVVTVLCVCSVFGNVGTLCVHRRRKLRIFFRACLISLALSDLITSVFTTIAYLAQFSAPSVQIWCIGGLLCRLIPFMTTGAILVSSMTLMGIAFDRYYAVMKATSFWQPNKKTAIVLVTFIWTLSFIFAFHVFFAYATYDVYVLREEDGSPDLVQSRLVSMCVSSKEMNAYYYLLVLAIIFIPTLVAFVWLNSIIANKLWIRRHSLKGPPTAPLPSQVPPSQLQRAGVVPTASNKPKAKQMEIIPQQYRHHNQTSSHPQQHPCHCRGDNKICVSSTLTSLAPSTGPCNPQHGVNGRRVDAATAVPSPGNNTGKHISSREARHLRMFTIIIILMAVFIFFRLPAWIFLIMRMYGTYTKRVDWILHFSFGILTLTSCVLNPLLYTFLTETIRYATLMKGKLCGLRRYLKNHCVCRCYCCLPECFNGSDNDDNQKMTQNQHQNENQNDKGGDNSNASDNHCTSNDGAKSTSRKSDDDSKVYTIIPAAAAPPPAKEEGDWCRR